jgi:predicted Zn-dependent peptidase
VSSGTYKRGEKLYFSYECDFIKDEFLPDGEKLLSEALGMFEELVFNPYLVDGGFDKKILDSEKTELENSIKSIINYKNAYVREKCIENLCKGERYAISEQGSLSEIPGITEKSLYEFYKWVLESAQVEIVFIGEADAQKLADDFKAIFEKHTKRAPETIDETYITGEVKEKVCELEETMQVNQGKLALGFRTGVGVTDKDCTSMSLFAEIFGGSPMSKLFMNVREKLSLCYYCRASLDSYKGIMLVLSGIQSKNRDKSFEAIMKELSDIQSGNVTEDEFEAAKLSLVNSYKTLDDSPAALSAWYISRIMCKSFENPEEIVNRIMNTTVEEVIEVSKKVRLDTVYFLKGEDGEEQA